MDLSHVFEKFGDQRIIALDIETTGGKKGINRIIQLGVIEYKNKNKVIEYSKTFGGGKSLQVCYNIHHISDDSRKGMPYFETACDSVRKYLSNAILIGHNIMCCDYRMISEALHDQAMKLENIKIIDTMKLSKKVLGLKSCSLENCCDAFGIEFGEHDALGDAKSCLELLDFLVEKRMPMDEDWFFEEVK